MLNVFLTGGSGLLGCHVIQRLQARADVALHVLARPGARFPVPLDPPTVRCVTGDILDPATPALPQPLDVVIHAAALTQALPAAGPAATQYAQVNVSGAAHVLEWAIQARARHFILISSCSVFGDVHDGLRDETAPCTPDSAYGASKLAAEHLVQERATQAGLPYTILRPGLIYGPYDRGAFMKMIAMTDRSVAVVPGPGHNLKSLVSARNAAAATVASMAHAAAFGETFLVVDERPYPLRAVFSEIARVLARGTRLVYLPAALVRAVAAGLDRAAAVPGLRLPVTGQDLRRFMSDNSYTCEKLKKKLHFQPQPDFIGQIAAAVDWYRTQRRTPNAG